MSKVKNRKKYKHNIDLIKYSEDGLRKRCKGCVEEFGKLQISGYCNKCWALYCREKRKGKTLQEIFQQYQYKWDILRNKYKNVKKCNTCSIIKNKNEFHPDKKAIHGLQNKCIKCTKEYNKKYGYLKERDRTYQNNKYKNDTNYKIGVLLRNRFYMAVLKNFKIKSVIKLLGCTIEQCKQHIESQFKPEMTWKNHGKVWEIDHIKPCSSFDLTKLEEQQKCFHYTNLQPLFKVENRSKGNKIKMYG